MSDSTRPKAGAKAKPRKAKAAVPKKPRKDFPLTPTSTGKWMKKIKGRLYYFGRWGNSINGKMTQLPGDSWWTEAKALYDAQIDDINAGLDPRAKAQETEDALTLAELAEDFLQAKSRKVAIGELTQRSFQELVRTANRVVQILGKTRPVESLKPADFATLRDKLAYGLRGGVISPVRLANEITRTRAIFLYATKNHLVSKPTQFGTEFEKPDKARLRKHRNESGQKLFTAEEVHLILRALDGEEVTEAVGRDGAKPKRVRLPKNPPLKAAVLLALNAGLGNTDVSDLEYRHIDFKSGWLHYARGKTGIDRRCPLWPETATALKAAIAVRPEPEDKKDKNVLLLTASGQRWIRVSKTTRTDVVTDQFSGLLRKLHINGRKSLGFYTLRHTFATIGLQTADRDAVKSLMGHAFGDVLALYDETGPSDERLAAVVNHVRTWLFGKGGAV